MAKELLTKEQGAQAIIDLQAIAGITESKDKAELSWGMMSDYEKSQTERAHKMVCGGFNDGN